jgi:hypothetical protein
MTAQIPDILIHRGERLSLCATPLDDYYRSTRKRRPRFVRPSTACYRGYVATWEIREGKIYLVGIEGLLARGRKEVTYVPADLATLFPAQEPRILATWITGELRCPEGGLRSYRHAGFGSEYERDRLIEVVEGSVVGEWLRLNPPEPILYRIDAAGGRTRVADYRDAKPLDDPFAPDETPKGHVFWGRPEDFGDSDGYEVWACLTYGRPG